MKTFSKEYLETIGFEKVNGRTYVKGDIRIKLFYQGNDGGYVMMALTSKSKLYPKREYRIPASTLEFDKIMDEYLSSDYSLNQFNVKGILLDKGEENPISGMITCMVEIMDKGASHAVIPVEFSRTFHSKLHYIEEQSSISLSFKLVSIFAKNKYIPKIIATNVE